MDSFLEKAKKLEEQGVFLGGPYNLFDVAGRKLLMILLEEGLYPESKVLDIGCGCLRGGYWLIQFLNKACYYGIEPNQEMMNMGLSTLFDEDIIEQKKPGFDHNGDFNFSVFEEKFDYYVARSIWTHASQEQICKMLDEFIKTKTENAVFLTSYIKTGLFEKAYDGSGWVGRSHESDVPGMVHHSFKWIKAECQKRNLQVEEIKDKTLNFGSQVWLRIK